MIGTLHSSARLLRGFAVDFLTSHDTTAVEWVMDPGYTLSIGGFELAGRDEIYLPATAAQLAQFPGLVVTAHDVILGEDWAALRFTEHGGSIRDAGRVAAWRGITLFAIQHGRLRRGWAEEDYFARKRQLKSGVADPVSPPHPAPWEVECSLPDPATERAVRRWLDDPATVLAVAGDNAVMVEGPGFAEILAPDRLILSALFTAGPRAAFHATLHGRYRGGFADIDPALIGASVALPVAAMVDVVADQVHRAQVSADRLGLHRQLLALSRAGERS